MNLLPHEERPARAWWKNWPLWLPIGLLALCVVVALVLPLVQKRTYAIALNKANEEARAAASVSEKLRSELDQLASDYNHVLARKYLFPSTVEVLNEVSKAMPDDTWLLQMEVKGSPRAKEPQRELLLRGESANAGKLIEALESSNVFTQAAPRSPVTKIQPGPGEIFDLAAQVRPMPPPAAAPANAMPDAAAPITPPVATVGAAPAGAPAVVAPAPAAATPGETPAAPAAPPPLPVRSPGSAPASAGSPAPAPGPEGSTPAAPAPAVAPPRAGGPPAGAPATTTGPARAAPPARAVNPPATVDAPIQPESRP